MRLRIGGKVKPRHIYYTAGTLRVFVPALWPRYATAMRPGIQITAALYVNYIGLFSKGNSRQNNLTLSGEDTSTKIIMQ